MKISKKGLDLIKKFEGFYEDAYICPANVWTIGFGTTVYANGKKVKKGDKISQSEALKLLEQQVNEHSSTISTYVQVELNQNQFDALASFQYNLGSNILRNSKLLDYINIKNWSKACEQILLYNKASGKVLAGLVKRRNAEVELFKEIIPTKGGNNMTDFICPIDNPKLTSKYGMRKHPVLPNITRLHSGIDLASTKERNPIVHSSADGIVRVVKNTGNSGYGKYVIITHNINGIKYETNYAHLDSYSVKVGQKVKQGEKIGIMGNTGIGTGIHLHFEIHEGVYSYDNGNYKNSLDPMKFINLNTTPSTIKTNTSSTPTPSPSNSKETITSYLENYNLDSSFTYRKELSLFYKISNYTGTLNQNNILLSKLQNDKTVMFRFYSGEVKDEITANKVKDKINSKQPNWTLHIIQLANKKWQVKSGTYKTFDSVAQASQIVSKLGYSVHIKSD